MSAIWLFSAKYQDNEWRNIQPLPFSSEAYSTGNSSVSIDGKTLYFSSNMPGGFGEIDIWKVAINDNGFYGKPENMGALINTPSADRFLNIAEDNLTLYFASKGHLGLGGYDVFKIKHGSSSSENLGKLINSEKDDFTFTYYNNQKMGFVSSNRYDDIFKVIPADLPANNPTENLSIKEENEQKEVQAKAESSTANLK
jgi:hypothetical protein